MSTAATLRKVKTDLRITHTALDGDIEESIDACLKDLQIVGVAPEDAESDPAILAAIKLWCRANYTDDTTKAGAYLDRYNAMKATFTMATGYGLEAEEEEAGGTE